MTADCLDRLDHPSGSRAYFGELQRCLTAGQMVINMLVNSPERQRPRDGRSHEESQPAPGECCDSVRIEASVSLTVRAFIVTLIVMSMLEQLSLAEAKAHLSEGVEGVETEHRRVVITKHGRPSVVVLAVADLEALEETLDVLSDPEAMADLREAEVARQSGASLELTKEEAMARWSRG